MRILQVIASLAPRYGGPSVACPALARELARRGVEVTIFTTDVDGPRRQGVCLTDSSVKLRTFPGWTWPGEYKLSPALARALHAEVPRFDLVHIYSMYIFPSTAAARACRQHGVPYLLHPHGTLDPYLRRRHTFRKRLYEALFERPSFRAAAAILFNSAEELRLAEDWLEPVLASLNGRPAPKRTAVPVGLDNDWFVPAAPEARREFHARFPKLAGRRLIVFFGRLSFKKGLDLLAQAFIRVVNQRPDVHLVVAGPDTEGFGRRLLEWLDEAQLAEKLTLTGTLAGKLCRALLGEAAVFVLPSYSENFGQAVAEAMACAVPVVISDRVNLHPEVTRHAAGLVVPCDATETAAAILHLLDYSGESRAMGLRGRSLAEQKFAWRVVGGQMVELYQEILHHAGTRGVSARAAAAVG